MDGINQLQPIETLYVRNLNERIRIEKLKDELSVIFRKFGPCTVIAMKGIRRKGQAWIVFDSVESSERALQALQGQTLHGKQMEISFSCNDSHETLIRKGLQVKRKVSEPSDDPEVKRGRALPAVDNFFSAAEPVARPTDKTSAGTRPYIPPNRVLLVENLPEKIGISEIESLFNVYAGFVEVRSIPGRKMAFVEFTDDHRSQVPLNKLNGFEFRDGSRISISNCRD